MEFRSDLLETISVINCLIQLDGNFVKRHWVLLNISIRLTRIWIEILLVTSVVVRCTTYAKRAEDDKLHIIEGNVDFILWSILIIASGSIRRIVLLLKGKLVNNFRSMILVVLISVDGIALNMLDGDNFINNDDRIEGSILFNIYGDEVITDVKCISFKGDWFWMDTMMEDSKVLVAFIGMSQSKDGASLDIWYSILTTWEVGMLSMRNEDDDIVFNNSIGSESCDSCSTHSVDINTWIKNDISIGFKVTSPSGDDTECINNILTTGDKVHNTLELSVLWILLRRLTIVDDGNTFMIFGHKAIAVIKSTSVLVGVIFNSDGAVHKLSIRDTIVNGSIEFNCNGDEDSASIKLKTKEGGKLDSIYGDVDIVLTTDNMESDEGGIWIVGDSKEISDGDSRLLSKIELAGVEAGSISVSLAHSNP